MLNEERNQQIIVARNCTGRSISAHVELLSIQKDRTATASNRHVQYYKQHCTSHEPTQLTRIIPTLYVIFVM